jgi:hypothetical protein
MADTKEIFTFHMKNNSRNELVIENNLNFENSTKNGDNKVFFFQEYQKAYNIVEKLFFENHENTSEDRKQDQRKLKQKVLINNTIVFDGQRGSGKTSVMISFADYLENRNSKDFFVLQLIDPSLFHENESILVSIISKMFQQAKEQINDTNTVKFQALAKLFNDVFKNIIKMTSLVKNEHSLEHLNDLSNSTNLSFEIHDLIREFIKFMPDEKKTLVIMIDDLDMNVSYAHKMLEEIRKYLIQDNLLILFATNLDQLQLELKEEYAKYFWSLNIHGHKYDQDNVGVDIEDMATKYLLKLFPPLHRIHLDNVSDKLLHSNLIIEDSAKYTNISNAKLQESILTLIWEKTRLIFIPPNGSLHPIIPTNLRALRQFIYMLLDMPSIPNNTESDKDDDSIKKYKSDSEKCLMTSHEIEELRSNFYVFKDYILNVWIPSNVTYDEYMEFENIPNEIDRVNKHLIQAINVIGSKYKKRLLLKDISFSKSKNIDDEQRKNEEKVKPRKFDKSSTDRDIYTFVSPNDPRFPMANKISDIYNFPSNNSMGDILLLVDKYKTYFEAANANNFIEAVKIYYSLLLFETMFYDEKSYFEVKEKYSDIPEPTNIQKLIGGTMYFPHYFEINSSKAYKLLLKKTNQLYRKIPKSFWSDDFSESIKNVTEKIPISDEVRKIYSEPLKFFDKEISDIMNSAGKAESGSNSIKIVEQLYNKYYNKQDDVEEHIFYHDYMLNDLEKPNPYFILYYGSSRPERSMGKHIYNTSKNNEDYQSVRFDMLALLVNMLNPVQTCLRFHRNEDKKTTELLNRLVEKYFNKGEKTKGIERKYIPNCIFPIYSVDLMLAIIKNSYEPEESSDIIKSTIKNADNNSIKAALEMEKACRDSDYIEKYYEFLIEKVKILLNSISIEGDKRIINRYEVIFNHLRYFIKLNKAN